MRTCAPERAVTVHLRLTILRHRSGAPPKQEEGGRCDWPCASLLQEMPGSKYQTQNTGLPRILGSHEIPASAKYRAHRRAVAMRASGIFCRGRPGGEIREGRSGREAIGFALPVGSVWGSGRERQGRPVVRPLPAPARVPPACCFSLPPVSLPAQPAPAHSPPAHSPPSGLLPPGLLLHRLVLPGAIDTRPPAMAKPVTGIVRAPHSIPFRDMRPLAIEGREPVEAKRPLPPASAPGAAIRLPAPSLPFP